MGLQEREGNRERDREREGGAGDGTPAQHALSQPHLFKDDLSHPKLLGTKWMIMTTMISQVEMRNMLLETGDKGILGTK